MRASLLPALLVAPLLAACDGRPAGNAGGTPGVTEGVAPIDTSGPGREPAGESGHEGALATFGGYGRVRFGMPAAEVPAAWGGELREVGQKANPSCYFLVPAWVAMPADFNLMVSEGRFVRYATRNPRFAAPGGGMVGMDRRQLQQLYDGALKEAPHKYVEGGSYLSIAASGLAPTRLVFELDAAGVATEWRVGLLPEVDYVEGCS